MCDPPSSPSSPQAAGWTLGIAISSSRQRGPFGLPDDVDSGDPFAH
jgi:hypothetical protein